MSEGRTDATGRLLIRTMTLPAQANLNGGVFGGWILSELDRAAGLLGMRRGLGPCTTVAIESLRFVTPMRIGEEFSIYGSVASVGRSSMRLQLEGWANPPEGGASRLIVEGLFVSVAIDEAGRPRPVPAEDPRATGASI